MILTTGSKQEQPLKIFLRIGFALSVELLSLTFLPSTNHQTGIRTGWAITSSPFFFELVMRRYRQALSRERCIEVLERGTSGVLSLIDSSGLPYGVPLNYVLRAGTIYFHSIGVGRKIDAIALHNRASFTVIDQDQIDSGRYTSLFVSVIAEGTIARIEGEEWITAFDALCCKYSADRPLAERQAKVSACTKAIGLKLTISSMTGKEAKELAGVSYP